MKKFTDDNTEGYSQEQLDELNEKYESRIADYEIRHECEASDQEKQGIAEDVEKHYSYCKKCDDRMMNIYNESV